MLINYVKFKIKMINSIANLKLKEEQLRLVTTLVSVYNQLKRKKNN